MQPKVHLPHAPTSPEPDASPDQGTDRLQSTASASGISVREFFAVPDVYPESLLRTDEAGPWISYASATLSHEIRPDPWWHAIPAALSWVKNFLIEGFAAYGAAMQPGYFQLYERDHADWPASQDAPPGTVRDRDAAVSSIDPSDVATAKEVRTAGWRTWIRSPLAWLSGSRSQADRTGLIISGLDDLDDRTRQDIGYRDYEIADFAWRRRQHE